MNFKDYQFRKNFIKRMIFYFVLGVGLLMIFFLQTQQAGGVQELKTGSKLFLQTILVQAENQQVNLDNKYAQGEPIDPCTLGAGCSGNVNEGNLGRGSDAFVKVTVEVIYVFIFVSVGISALFIIFGGYQLFSANGDKNQYENGLRTVRYSVFGMVLCIMSLSIVYIVSTILVDFELFG